MGEGNGTPLQYSCLENPMDGGAWWAAVHGVVKSRTRLRDFTFPFHFHALEKEMATHSCILAWENPTERPPPPPPPATRFQGGGGTIPRRRGRAGGRRGLGAGWAERGGTSDIPGTPGPRPPERGGREGGI